MGLEGKTLKDFKVFKIARDLEPTQAVLVDVIKLPIHMIMLIN